MTPVEIIADISNIMRSLPSRCEHRRIRYAITPEEDDALRDYCIENDPNGRYYMRIRNIPLVVESEPSNPPLQWQDAQSVQLGRELRDAMKRNG